MPVGPCLLQVPPTHAYHTLPLAAPPFRCTCLAPLPPLLDSIFNEPIWRLHHKGAPAMQLSNEYNIPQYIPQVTLAQYTSTSHCTRIRSSPVPLWLKPLAQASWLKAVLVQTHGQVVVGMSRFHALVDS